MIFLFDGTANDATDGTGYSNVYAINQLIADRKTVRGGHIQTQVTFYLPGIGTKFTVRTPDSFFMFALRSRHYLFGDGIEQQILRAYVNLSANYHPGDEIVLIGFSRGAVAARIFSRLISDFGILSSDMLFKLDALWSDFVEISFLHDVEYFSSIDKIRNNFAAEQGSKVFHAPEEQPIRFLGAFDTVAGLLDNSVIKNIKFRDQYPAKGVKHAVHILAMHETREEFLLRRFQPPPNPPTSKVREIWLPGVHADIGGGYEHDFIANIALLTMCELLTNLGGVAVDEVAYGKTLSEARSQAQFARFVINKEPSRRRKKTREAAIDKADEIHPLHWHLLNKQVFWKDLKEQTPYFNSIRQVGHEEPDLRRAFNRWLGLGRADGQPASPLRKSRGPSP